MIGLAGIVKKDAIRMIDFALEAQRGQGKRGGRQPTKIRLFLAPAPQEDRDPQADKDQ